MAKAAKCACVSSEPRAWSRLSPKEGRCRALQGSWVCLRVNIEAAARIINGVECACVCMVADCFRVLCALIAGPHYYLKPRTTISGSDCMLLGLAGAWGTIVLTIICDCAQGMDEDEWELIGLERGLVSACQDYITQFYYWCKVYFLI